MAIEAPMTRPGLKTILYVDDEPDIRQIVEMALELGEDLTIETCDSGESALARLAASKPDLVMLDVMMPGMDGPTTLQRMRADSVLASIPVIFMTAKAMPNEVARFIEMGAVGVIPKPFDPMTLYQQVCALWNGLPR